MIEKFRFLHFNYLPISQSRIRKRPLCKSFPFHFKPLFNWFYMKLALIFPWYCMKSERQWTKSVPFDAQRFRRRINLVARYIWHGICSNLNFKISKDTKMYTGYLFLCFNSIFTFWNERPAEGLINVIARHSFQCFLHSVLDFHIVGCILHTISPKNFKKVFENLEKFLWFSLILSFPIIPNSNPTLHPKVT